MSEVNNLIKDYKEIKAKDLKAIIAETKANIFRLQEIAKIKKEEIIAIEAAEAEKNRPVQEEPVPVVNEIQEAEPEKQPEAIQQPEVKAEESAPKTEEITVKEPEAEPEIIKPQKPLPKPKSEFEKVIIDEVTGNIRRIFIAPEPVKKSSSGMTSRDFGKEGYKQTRNPQGTTKTPQKPGIGQRAQTSRPGMSEPPAQFPPKKDVKSSKPANKQNQGNSAKFDDKTQNKRSLMKKGFIVNEVEYDEDGEEIVRTYKQKGQKGQSSVQKIDITSAVITADPVSIKTLSEKIGKTAAEIIKVLFMVGTMKTINDSISIDEAKLVAGEFGIEIEFKPDVTKEETLIQQIEENDIEELDNLEERPPIITIMGHVDHGKTSLLDYIRKTNVTKGEAGGITQAIGAYTIKLNDKPITFIDTPGHELFTSMRARGAQVTDIVILVVAADDGIMPQTIESISHAKQANVPIIVAVNKIDKPGANPDRVLTQLTEHGLVPEDWGGDTPVVKVSAKTGENIDTLLENILILADVLELRANPNRTARGTIIEAKLDKSLGKIATILVQTGTLNIGDNVVAGTCTGKIRAMIDDKGNRVKKAGPSIPVSVTGWDDVPSAGDRIDVVKDEKFARDLAEERRLIIESKKNTTSSVSLVDFLNMTPEGEKKHLKLIVKTDVQGSLESIKQYLVKVSTDDVSVDVIHGAVGGINESDVSLAETSGAIIIGFNVRPDTNAKLLAQQKKIEIRFYNIVYDMIEDLEKAVKGLLDPKFEEVSFGSAEVREIFKISGVGNIAGCRVLEGKIIKAGQARVIRNGKVEYTGKIGSLRHEKDDVKEMAKGFECGIMLENFQDVKVGDIIESFNMQEITDED